MLTLLLYLVAVVVVVVVVVDNVSLVGMSVTLNDTTLATVVSFTIPVVVALNEAVCSVVIKFVVGVVVMSMVEVTLVVGNIEEYCDDVNTFNDDVGIICVVDCDFVVCDVE
jgi:hypothetical protein